MDQLAQSSSETETGPGQCGHCGATIQLRDGICVSCFLKEGLETERQGSADVFESVLAEADVPDLEWRLGNYKVIKEIGRGGMGAVYLAQRADEQYEKRVAIKLIKRGMDTESVLRHFRTERQILAGFDHPNIARLFDGGMTENGLPYFIMEYVEGLPIDEYCNAHALSISERLKLFREVCAAVSYAHRHLVIHRDIKRSNILITVDGVPKLLDFGIAKILQQGNTGEPLATVTSARLMTPEYASPEQVRGESVTTASDVYSLGVVLYELLTGKSPYHFTSQSPYDVARIITETEPKKPSTTVATRDGNPKSEVRNPKLLRGDLDNIIMVALRKEPERRYQSVEQFSEDIGRHLETRPVLARKDTVSYRAGKFVRRNRVGTIAAALILLSLIGGVIATTWQAHRAKLAKVRAEHRFNDVRQLAHSVLFDYHDAIKDLPGATRVRERLVKDALTYLDSLAGEASGDPDLQRELAAAYERVGDVRGNLGSASLGDRAGALDSYQRALHIRETLVTSAPRDITNRRNLAASYKKIGNQLLGTSRGEEGLALLRKSLALYSELAAEHPTQPDIRHDLAEIHTNLGAAMEIRGEMPAALEYYNKVLPIYEGLLAGNPQDRLTRRSLSVTYESIGRALFLSGRTNEALESNGKALELRQALFSEDPTNNDYRRILGVSYQNNGDYLAWNKKTQNALESFRKKLAIDEEAVAADPANAQALGDLGYSCQRIGDLLAELADPSQAIPFYQRAVEIRERAMAIDPQELALSIQVSGLTAKLGKAYAKLGNTEPARSACSKAADLLLATPDDSNTDAEQRRIRVLAFGEIAEAYVALASDMHASPATIKEDWRNARDMYQRSLDIMKDLREKGILDQEEVGEIETTSRKIANCDEALKR